jgi:hypothetical protein
MRLNIMQSFEAIHNANLHQTLPEQAPIVNNTTSTVDKCISCSAAVDVSLADTTPPATKTVTKTDKLFVKIDNLIFNYYLHPRLLEFYCLMCFFTFAYPNCELPILTIQTLILEHTRINWNKDTINKYINDLIELDLISRNQKYYTITDLSTIALLPVTPPIPLDKRVDRMDGSCINSLYKNKSHKTVSSTDTSNLTNSRRFTPPSYQEGIKGQRGLVGNNITQPKSKYTIFHITIYNRITKAGSAGLEFYMASKINNEHRPTKVCKDLSICRKTYYTYLADIVSSKVVQKTKLSYDSYHYTHDYRLLLWSNCVDLMSNKYKSQAVIWEKSKAKKEFIRSNNSRRWYASDMAKVMKKYNINYIKAFNNYKPADAYDIVQELELQYSKWNKTLNAKLVVKAILNNYNWIKIVDKRHTIIKQGLASMSTSVSIVGNRLMDNMFKVDYS